MSNNVLQFTGAYYPFSYLNLEAIKLYSIFFDSISILIPPTIGLYAMPEYERKRLAEEIELRDKFITETAILRENGILKLWEPTSDSRLFPFNIEDLWWKYIDPIEVSEKDIKNRMSSWLSFIEQSTLEGDIPFTDNPRYYQHLTNNYSKRFKNGSSKSYKQYGFLKEGATELAIRTLENNLPRFNCYSFEDVLELRLKLKDSIDQFRSTMMMYSSKVKKTPWDEDFVDEINRIIVGEIEPAIMNLRSAAEDIKYRKTSTWIKSSLSLKPLPIVATTFIGVPIEISIGIAVGAITLEAYLKNKQLSHSIDNNGFSLLLKI